MSQIFVHCKDKIKKLKFPVTIHTFITFIDSITDKYLVLTSYERHCIQNQDTTRLLVQKLVGDNHMINTKSQHFGPFEGNPPGTNGFPAERIGDEVSGSCVSGTVPVCCNRL